MIWLHHSWQLVWFNTNTKMLDGVDRLSQTRPIPRSPDGNKKMETFSWEIFLFQFVWILTWWKDHLLNCHWAAKRRKRKGKWEKKKKWGTIVPVSRGNKWWSATLGRSYWMHHPAWPPISSSCDENIWWAYYFLSKINSERSRFFHDYFLRIWGGMMFIVVILRSGKVGDIRYS